MDSAELKHLVRTTDESLVPEPKGQMAWLVDAEIMPGAEQTFGISIVLPGHRNDLHRHPNCEELLYIISGECDQQVGDEHLHMTPGMLVRIPRGVPHCSRGTGDEPCVQVVSCSSPQRVTESLETDEG